MSLPALDLFAYPVLVVDDEPDNLDAFRFNFKRNFSIRTAGGGEEGLAVLEQGEVAVIITDQRMPRMTGLEFLRAARERRPDAVGIIVTAYTDVDVLIEAINQGQVYRYITKPWDAKEVRGVLAQAIERFHLLRENRRLDEQLRQYAGYLRGELHGAFDYGAIVGEAPALREVLARVEQVAPTSSTVLLLGETGTGKELVAHAIHINSPREDGPFVRVNCGALAPGVLESELFGHEKGAFTGALARRAGRFELASGGTLFLDEVGDLPPEVQVKLLRVLQEREIERVGGNETLRVDVRVVSATNRDLESLVAKGRFREDLYYRLNVFPIHIPPLRERLSDIPGLAEHFVGKFARQTGKGVIRCDPPALAMLQTYPWPGNVRELENIVERAMILCRGDTLTVADLDFGRRLGGGQPASGTLPGTLPSGLPACTGAGSTVTALPPRGAPATAWTAQAGVTGVTGVTGGATGAGTAGAVCAAGAAAVARPLAARLQEEERREIVAAIEQCGGNIAGAARLLGINRSTLYYRLRKHGLEHLLPTRPGAEAGAAGEAAESATPAE